MRVPFGQDGHLWVTVGDKGNARWLWTALCRRTRQVLANGFGKWFWQMVLANGFGKRDIATGQKLWRTICELPEGLARYRFGPVFTDAHAVYDSVIPKKQHWPSDQDSGQGGTNHLERFHLTLRQRLARLTRKTRAFSKSEEMHEINLRLFFHRYNLEQKERYLSKPHHLHE